MSGSEPSARASEGREREERQLALIHRIARVATETSALRAKLHLIVQLLKEHMRCEFVACASIDSRAGRFRCEALASDIPSVIHVGYGRVLGSGVVGEVAATGRKLYVADVAQHPNYVETMPGTRSELCVAVRHNGEVMAVLNAESTQVRAFDDCVDLLITVAEQVAGIFLSTRLNDEQRRRVELLGMLSQLSRAAIEANGLDEALRRIVNFFRDRFGLESVAVLLADENGTRLNFSAHVGTSVFHGRSGGDWPTSLGIVGRAFRTREAQYVADVVEDPDYVLGNPAVVAEFVVPIRFHGRFLGLLNLEASNAESLSEANRQMLAALADQVAGAVHLAATNDRLHETNRLFEEKSEALILANGRLREVNRQLERLSNLDGLTGIANRRRFDEMLASEWGRALRHGHALSLLLLDIDEFKPYNDGYGHLAGDDALRQVAKVLSNVLTRAEDVVARFGGEEFAILLPQTAVEGALRVAEHLASAVAGLALPHAYARTDPLLTISIGVASVVADNVQSPIDFVMRADRALYRAKALGRNRIELDDSPTLADVG